MKKIVATSTVKVNGIYKKYGENYEGRYLFLFGGAGSGKSVYGVQKSIQRFVNDDIKKQLFIRKVANTLNDSLFGLSKRLLSDYGFYDYTRINKQDKSIEFPSNSNCIVMKGMDDEEKVKSIDNIGSILVEEITELSESEFLQLDLRLRGESNYKQIVGMFNPISDEHWLVKYVEPQKLLEMPKDIINFKVLLYDEDGINKVWEFEKVQEIDGVKEIVKTRVINTTYKDNKFIDNQYKAVLKNLAAVSHNYYQVYEKGRWGRIEVGEQFAQNFDETRHTSKSLEQKKGATLHFSVDFNVKPYMSGLVMNLEWNDENWKGHSGFWDLTVFDEFSLEFPKNNSNDLGKEFADKYEPNDIFYLYGDASGNNQLGTKEVKTLYIDLKNGMGEQVYYCKERVPTSNPRYKNIAKGALGRRAFLNLLFSGVLPVRIKINSDKCINFIKDLKYCEQDKNGAMLKKKNKHGVEERGHHLDLFQYFICHPKTLGFLATIK